MLLLFLFSLQLVIANILQTRKHRVVFVTPTSSYEVHLSREQALQGLEIEEPIVADVVSTKKGEGKTFAFLWRVFVKLFIAVVCGGLETLAFSIFIGSVLSLGSKLK